MARPAHGDAAFDHSIQTHHGPSSRQLRVETDSLGSIDVPADAYWGVHTARVLQNCAITGRPISEYPISSTASPA